MLVSNFSKELRDNQKELESLTNKYIALNKTRQSIEDNKNIISRERDELHTIIDQMKYSEYGLKNYLMMYNGFLDNDENLYASQIENFWKKYRYGYRYAI